MDPLRPLPTYADVACYPGQVGDPCSHVPASRRRAARSTRRTASYVTRVPTRDVTERFPLLDAAFARYPMPRAGSGSRGSATCIGYLDHPLKNKHAQTEKELHSLLAGAAIEHGGEFDRPFPNPLRAGLWS